MSFLSRCRFGRAVRREQRVPAPQGISFCTGCEKSPGEARPEGFLRNARAHVCSEPEGYIALTDPQRVLPLGAIIERHIVVDNEIVAYTYRMLSAEEKQAIALLKDIRQTLCSPPSENQE